MAPGGARQFARAAELLLPEQEDAQVRPRLIANVEDMRHNIGRRDGGLRLRKSSAIAAVEREMPM